MRMLSPDVTGKGLYVDVYG